MALTLFECLIELQDINNICNYACFWKSVPTVFERQVNRIIDAEKCQIVTLHTYLSDVDTLLAAGNVADIDCQLDLIFLNYTHNSDRPSIAISILKKIAARYPSIKLNLIRFRLILWRIQQLVSSGLDLMHIIETCILKEHFDSIFSGIDDDFSIELPDDLSGGKTCRLYGLFYDINALRFINEIACNRGPMRPVTILPDTERSIFDYTFGDYMRHRPDMLVYLDDTLTKCLN